MTGTYRLGRYQRVLVTGGVRSGKSRHAEKLLVDHKVVDYVAPGAFLDPGDDPDWFERVVAHRTRRPAAWLTWETDDLADVFIGSRNVVLVDCLGTWLTSRLDRLEAWEWTMRDVQRTIFSEVDEAMAVLRDHESPVVFVTNEVGLGVVPEHRSGRLFRDLLGSVNQRWATICDEVHLVVAGRVLVL